MNDFLESTFWRFNAEGDLLRQDSLDERPWSIEMRSDGVAFLQAFFGGRLFDAALLDEMLTDWHRIFSPLEYNASRTCCWNGSSTAMYSLIVALAEKQLAVAEADGRCEEPLVFKARDIGVDGSDGYAIYRGYAESLGQEDDWVPWSNDERCAWTASTEDDLTADLERTAWCDLPADAPDTEGDTEE